MLAVIRLRGTVKVNTNKKRTLEDLGLKRRLSMAIVPDDRSMRAMVRESESHTTWGELPADAAKRFAGKRVWNLAPPKGQLRDTKKALPKGELGYRGAKIVELIERMMPREGGKK